MGSLITVQEYCEFYNIEKSELNEHQLEVILNAVSDYLRQCFLDSRIGNLNERLATGKTSEAIVKLCVAEIVKKQYNALQKSENTDNYSSLSQSIGDYNFSFSNPANPMTIPIQYKRMLGLNKITVKKIRL